MNKEQDKYQIVKEILSASDYYHVLGIKKNVSVEEIRRAYIRRSRVCHPDKFVPAYPKATESFQLLSIAYETLSNPSSRIMYDLSTSKRSTTANNNNKGANSTSFPKHYSHKHDTNPNDTLQRVLQQVYIEMLDGEFETMRAFIHALNETNPGMHITEDVISQIELGFQRLRELLKYTQQYYKLIQFEIMKLYELQQELRSLSYFSLWKRMQLSLTICKIILQLPIIINTEIKKEEFSSCKVVNDNQKQGGILNYRIEHALQVAVNLLETGERFTEVW
ncbi:MAG: hypothetical protein EXX96DRAFT_588389 [Benjaminiella poitrasii]|nr:MAG: hypothetical protein EXX96DRAFT_588389 [Benjaminiella poitrasii]